MIRFDGRYFDGKSSQATAVTVWFDGIGLRVAGDDLPADIIHPASLCSIDPPLGNTRRVIRFPGGAICETDDHAAVSALERLCKRNRGFRIIHWLESHWKAAMGCLVGLAAIFAVFIFYGLPLLAERAAYMLPQSILTKASKETASYLDKGLFKPTGLSADRIAEIKALFEQTVRDVDPAGSYRAEFRKGGQMRANALALPSGVIFITDELIQLASDDREIAGVIAHETAHIKNRHAVRQVIQGSVILIVMAFLGGDVSSVSSFAGALPAILVGSGYSRDFEREADIAAARYLIGKGWGTKPYEDMLEKLDKDHPEQKGCPNLFSSHPKISERIKDIRRISSGNKRQADRYRQ